MVKNCEYSIFQVGSVQLFVFLSKNFGLCTRKKFADGYMAPYFFDNTESRNDKISSNQFAVAMVAILQVLAIYNVAQI